MSGNKSNFSGRFNDALIKMAMIDEMARADNWRGIDECLAIKPEAIKMFTRYADAAMRAIKQMEKEAPDEEFSIVGNSPIGRMR